MATIAFIGTGKIAQAFIKGLAEAKWNLVAYDPSTEALKLAEKLGATSEKDSISAVKKAETVIVCTKPEKVTTVLNELSGDLEEKLVISVAAGVPTQKILAALDKKIALVRAMPNTPAFIGSAMTGIFATEEVTLNQRQTAQQILASLGKTRWLEVEEDLDIVTALSGSGPAYFFLLMEQMIEAGIAEGLSPEIARELVVETALGSAKMASMSIDNPQILRENVTSPGGTTEAALDVFYERGFVKTVAEAIKSAQLRSKEISED